MLGIMIINAQNQRILLRISIGAGKRTSRTKVEGDVQTGTPETSGEGTIHNFNMLKNTSLVTVTSSTTEKINATVDDTNTTALNKATFMLLPSDVLSLGSFRFDLGESER